MSHRDVFARIEEGVSLRKVVDTVDGSTANGQAVTARASHQATPYLDHGVAAFVDGPPTSNVVAVISGRSPSGGWRRFTLSRTGPWQYELEVFPSVFKNGDAPLAPGIPPSTSRRG